MSAVSRSMPLVDQWASAESLMTISAASAAASSLSWSVPTRMVSMGLNRAERARSEGLSITTRPSLLRQRAVMA